MNATSLEITNWPDWLKENKLDTLDKTNSIILRDKVMKEPSVAKVFFYIALSPIVRELRKEIQQSSNLKVPPCEIKYNDIASLIYAGVYDRGKWTRIKSYRGDVNICQWMRMLSKQIVFEALIQEGLLGKAAEKDISKISLKLNSMQFKDEVEAAIDILENEASHNILYDLYVNKYSKESIMATYNIKENDYTNTLKKAELALKTALLERGNYIWIRTVKKGDKEIQQKVDLINLALGSRVNGLNVTTNEQEYDIALNKYGGDDDDPLKFLETVFDTKTDISLFEQGHQFLLNRIKEMKVTKERRYHINEIDEKVWLSAFVYDEAPEILAKRLGRRCSWVYNRKKRVGSKIVKYSKNWLAKRAHKW